MIDILLGQFGGWIIAAVSFVIGAAGLYIKGRRDARRGAKLDAAKGYIKTRERMDDAERDLPDDPDQLREWLRRRGAKR